MRVDIVVALHDLSERLELHVCDVFGLTVSLLNPRLLSLARCVRLLGDSVSILFSLLDVTLFHNSSCQVLQGLLLSIDFLLQILQFGILQFDCCCVFFQLQLEQSKLFFTVHAVVEKLIILLLFLVQFILNICIVLLDELLLSDQLLDLSRLVSI